MKKYFCLLALVLISCSIDLPEAPSEDDEDAISVLDDTPCVEIDPSVLTNGTTGEEGESIWTCQSTSLDFHAQLFEDGTGDHSVLGQFDWEENDCGQIEVSAEDEDFLLINVEGSRESGVFNFTEVLSADESDEVAVDVECVLVVGFDIL